MSKKFNKKPLAVAMGTAMATALSIAPTVNAGQNPFQMSDLSSGYMEVAQTELMGGADVGQIVKDKATDAVKDKATEAVTGTSEDAADKTKKEGKCGEGKCGEGKCGGSKSGSEKGSEGQCAGKMEGETTVDE